ncbi:nuclease-related domain-containing protein [Halalkalibacter akibai]|uniref:NERD domain-containing protein n=1 Tax=Halalkalibacter akibai (strain ATCC 43226 / DSM 21942 / CIP 109018 / JCM 9157 / 1139) TaxID=1236973 RepID=W4QRL6_HALA3|nr:nuclease-related domain-containing protein [Halalkalibacter akibai]GAE34750.1 hypothetical protein JCM9157_1827 [Halalkalibacter akibai JCM 9157]
MEIILFLIVLAAIIIGPKYKQFRDSEYEVASGNTFFKTLLDKGNYGEYLTYLSLKKQTGYHRIMTNLYIPKQDGTTTEIDVLFITESGLFVLESKNYSGWIFGDEKHKNWTQMLPNRKKYSFFNPIWQNKAHINALKLKVGVSDDRLYKSYIIFSERCQLKKITVTSPEIKVIKRDQLQQMLQNELAQPDKVLTPILIEQIFAKLKKYSCVDDVIKRVHIDEVKRKSKRA